MKDLSTILHDMRNRLASMKSAAELILLGNSLSSEDARNMHAIVGDIDQITELMNELHSVAKKAN